MEQHPVPRQITTFEFKLIGFMTLKQFLYLLVFFPLAFVFFKIIPIPVLNIVVAAASVAAGAALAFVPINDQPLDAWVTHFYKRLTSPTQYTYHKHNQSLYFLQNLYFTSDPHKIMSHIESRDKLAAYLTTQQHDSTTARQQSTDPAQVQTLLQQSTATLQPQSPTPPPSTGQAVTVEDITPVTPPPAPREPTKRPFFIGIVKNNKKIPLPGIMIYVKDLSGVTVRLLKTNPHGVFATYNSLPPGEYTFEIKDPKGAYFFDTMKCTIESENLNPIEIGSKELL